MMFQRIEIEDLRIIRHMDLVLEPGIDLVVGDNGAGKTTVLEALHLLATGRSFRHRETAPLIREGAEAVSLVGRFTDAGGGRHVLGMRKGRDRLEVRLDGRSSVRRSEVVAMLPVQFIGADPQQLVSGAPELRRQFLDTGLFHVEPGYLSLLQRYHRVLDQRNAALRQGDAPLAQWDRQLAEAGTHIDAARRRLVDRLEKDALALLTEWALPVDLSFRYRSGWARGLSLGEALGAHRERDRRNRFTGAGPHRADWVVQGRVTRSGKELSRGQLKLVASALHLVLASIIAEARGAPPVLLYDDLASELDRRNRRLLLDALSQRYRQAVITALAPDDLPDLQPARVFHVEQGRLISTG